jgi:hypothetical protein
MPDYPIKTSDINADIFFGGAFDNTQTEISAGWLVRMAQENGDWRDFTQEEIDKFCQNQRGFPFNRLTDDGTDHPPIKKNDDGSYSFTHKFIAKCFLSSPAVDQVLA